MSGFSNIKGLQCDFIKIYSLTNRPQVSFISYSVSMNQGQKDNKGNK